MTILLLENDKSQLEQILQRVFVSFDPFEFAVRDELCVRAVLYPTDSYHLAYKQFVALTKTIEAQPEAGFYVSEIEQTNPFDTGNHWYCKQPTFDEYTHLPTGVENAVYSANGDWGILVSHELHALVACDNQFWNKFEENYPTWKDDLRDFIQYWKEVESEGVVVDWLPKFLKGLHVEGVYES